MLAQFKIPAIDTDMTTPGKRLLSPEALQAENPDEKRKKGEHTESIDESDEVDINLAKLIMEDEKEPTRAELKKYMDTILKTVNDNGLIMKELATKQNYEEVRGQMTAQGLEIQELREEVKKLQDSVKNIEANADLHMAENLNRMTGSAGREYGSGRFNMATADQNKAQKTLSK